MSAKSEKARATKTAKRAGFAAQTIPITDDWRIVRADEMNWEVQHQSLLGKWVFHGYYHKLPDALQSLAGKMLDQQAHNSLTDVLRTISAIREDVRVAMEGITK